MARTRKNRFNESKKKVGGDTTDRKTNIFDSTKLSTQLNTDPSYVESGLIHVSESRGINAVRGVVTGITNFFGAKGVDNAIYDILRNETLAKLNELVGADEKVCNLRLEFDNPNPGLLFHHAYGTLLKKKPVEKQEAKAQEQPTPSTSQQPQQPPK